MRYIQISFLSELSNPRNGFYWKDITDYDDHDSDDPCYCFIEVKIPEGYYLNSLNVLKKINSLCQDCGKEYFIDCECCL